ncbi:Uncharacterised protein [Mycobacterium tuberculosis]|nr:Uncharacterised protein [Mycobacterium tuberculosis]
MFGRQDLGVAAGCDRHRRVELDKVRGDNSRVGVIAFKPVAGNGQHRLGAGAGIPPAKGQVGKYPGYIPQRQIHDEQFRGAVNVGGFDLLIDDAGGQFEGVLRFQGRTNIVFAEFAVFHETAVGLQVGALVQLSERLMRGDFYTDLVQVMMLVGDELVCVPLDGVCGDVLHGR